MTGRARFHLRWARRLLAREPSRHALICAVLAALTAGLTFVGALLWHGTRPPVASIGPRAHELILADDDRQPLADGLQAVRSAGLRPVIVREETVRFPGAASEMPLRDQPLTGALGGRPFAILDGRLPHGPDEIAVTERGLVVLRDLVGPATAIGESVPAGARARTLVGVVRDPRDHQSAAMFVDRGVRLAPSSISVYTTAPADRLFALQADNPSILALVPVGQGTSNGVVPLSVMVALGVLLVVGLLSAVTYAVSARRRLHEYGMLGAIGATSRQLRATITTVGMITGIAAGVPGAVAGFVLAGLGTGWLETFLARDLLSPSIPIWVPVAAILVTAGVSTAAARRPASTIARVPVVDALAGRTPPRQRSARGVRFAPVVLIAAAVAFVAGAATDAILLLFSGPLLTLIGVLLISPLLVRHVGRGSGRGPTAWRFALRDLARKPGSSIALLAGLTALLTLPASIAVLTASAEKRRAMTPPNLPSNMLLVEGAYGGLNGFSPAEPDRAGAEALLERAHERLPRARTTAVQVPIAPGTPVNRSEYGARHPVLETVWAVQRRQLPPRVTSDVPVWIATPRLLATLDHRAASADVLSDNPAPVAFRTPRGAPDAARRPAPLGAPASELLGEVWVSPAFAGRRGWRAHTAGWLVVSDKPIPDDVRRELATAAAPHMKITGHEPVAGDAFPARWLMFAACLAALVLAVAVLALERLELERDARIYMAIGARRGLLRVMVGTRTGVLAAVAALSAILVAYAVWLANRLFSSDEPPLAVPLDLLALVAVVLPLVLGGLSSLAGGARSRR